LRRGDLTKTMRGLAVFFAGAIVFCILRNCGLNKSVFFIIRLLFFFSVQKNKILLF
jgi:uncharacterized membrane protein